jgi:mannitol/fructose-specific phosphotransferase system IIA component
VIDWNSPVTWDRFWQIVALLICIAAIGTEIMGWSTYVPARMREGG